MAMPQRLILFLKWSSLQKGQVKLLKNNFISLTLGANVMKLFTIVTNFNNKLECLLLPSLSSLA
jgi:hypothetical protein